MRMEEPSMRRFSPLEMSRGTVLGGLLTLPAVRVFGAQPGNPAAAIPAPAQFMGYRAQY